MTHHAQAYRFLITRYLQPLAISLKFALGALLLTTCTRLSAQTLQVYYQGNVLNSGDAAYIDQTPSMPNIQLALSDACGTVSYSINIKWTSPKGKDKTGGQVSGSFACGQTETVDWSQLTSFEGGNATIYWSVYFPNGRSAGQYSFSFKILGTNPTPAQVDSVTTYPWMFDNVIQWESRYHQFIPAGYPLDCECPSGMGLGQMDYGHQDWDAWEWTTNLSDSQTRLTQAQTDGSKSLSNEYVQMVATTGGNPVNPDDYPINPYCDFQYPQHGGDSYSDANAILYYNEGAKYNATTHVYAHAFLFWIAPSGANPGHWDPEDGGNDGNYVHDVCRSTPQ